MSIVPQQSRHFDQHYCATQSECLLVTHQSIISFAFLFCVQQYATTLLLLIFIVLMKSMGDNRLAPEQRVLEYSASFLTFQAVWRGYLARHGGKGKGKGKGKMAKKPSKKKK